MDISSLIFALVRLPFFNMLSTMVNIRCVVFYLKSMTSRFNMRLSHFLQENFSNSREKSSLDRNALLDLSETLKEQVFYQFYFFLSVRLSTSF